MKQYIYILFLAISSSLFATNPLAENDLNSNKSSERYYPAQEKEGYIGVFDEKPLDSPTDNVFKVAMDVLPQADEEVWLTYELYGINNHTGISRSINDQLAVGGYLVTLNKSWKKQEEQLKAEWLQKGTNIIRFTLPEHANYNYRIKNLGIQIKKKTHSGRAIIINQPLSQEYNNNLGYIKGFIEGKDAQSAQVFIDDIRIRSLSSEFEALIPKKTEGDIWTATLKVAFPDGETITKQIQYKKQTQAHYQNNIAIRSANHTIKSYTPSEAFTLDLQDVRIQIAPQSLIGATPISITALRDVDIPALDGTMVNVTKNHTGFRFLPHGTQFSKEASITLGYDIHKIPEGYTAKDIKTYYFDEKTKHWVALKRDSINTQTHQIVSKTTHFTDMINGIIKTPESPETAGFTPTSIKDIKAANPSAAINTIEPPSANSMGTANIGYPIVVPAGRQGIQPQLGIQYNSGGGNGWLGMGWNLSIPSIGIETRWGVPRYDASLETETYSMNGQMLAPVAHRGELQPRTSEKIFHPRVEGSFDRIIRHGDNPKNYWWEVTDKSGRRYSYGGTETKGIVENSVLKDDEGNIAYWALVEVRDLNDNFMLYECTKVDDVGIQGGSVPGRNIYIDRIVYTGHGSTEGKYEVLFTRDRELGEARRTDVSINARLGFKQVTADILRKVEVKFNNQPVRSYELTYRQGAFFKTLLDKVTEFDAAGNEFTNHEFEYFDDVNAEGGYTPYTSQENWNPQNDNVRGDFLVRVGDFNDDASAINGNKSSSAGFGSYIGVGPKVTDAELRHKGNTVGANFGYNRGKGEGMLSLIDINGDNLPDKVYVKGGSMRFRPNTSGPDGSTQFGQEYTVNGVDDFSVSSTDTFTFGIGAYFKVFAGLQYTNSTTKVETYFADVNGDRLLDVVHKGRVLFNHLENGVPTFTASSADTPSVIGDSTVGLDASLVEIDPAEIEAEIDQFPLHDIVRMWEAPFDGTVSIEGPITLDANSVDGVRVAIQHKGTELWNEEVTSGAITTPTGVDSITVVKGDRIYFRAQSILNGENDIVTWDPVITYNQHQDGLVDANGLPIYKFTASEGFILSSTQEVGAPFNGEITIDGAFTKEITSDEVTARIVKKSASGNSNVIWEKTYLPTEIANENLNISVVTLENEMFVFEVNTDSTIDYQTIDWTPHIFYTSSNDPSITTVTNPDGSPMITFYPSVQYKLWDKVITPTASWEALLDGNVNFVPQFLLNDNTLSGEVTFAIKRTNELISKQKLTYTNGVLDTSTPLSPVTVDVIAGEIYFFDLYSENIDLLEALNSSVEIDTGTAISTTISTGTFTTKEATIFGAMYRNWGQFGYNGNRDRATQPINESELNMDELENQSDIDISGTNSPEEMEQSFADQGGQNISEEKFIFLLADNENKRWKGNDDMHWLSKESMSASRLGKDDVGATSIIPDTGGSISSSPVRGITKITKSNTIGFSAGGGAGISTASGSTKVETEFLDFNGDSYPDIISKNKVQFTYADGTLEASARDLGTSYFNKTDHTNIGISLNGSPTKSKSQIGTTQPDNTDNSSTGTSNDDSQSTSNEKSDEAKATLGLSAGGAINDENVKEAFTDVNGDGLPDKVFSDGRVSLNLGYKFAAPESWGAITLRDGKGEDFNAGLGVSIRQNSISGGIGLSLTQARAENALQDINGDGLTDYFEKDSNTILLNTGNGFVAIPWSDLDDIQENFGVGESANASFTIGIPIPPVLPGLKISINPSVQVNHGASREKIAIIDINGDGFPDILTSTKDNELQVKRSTIGRTNLLKAVKRPLGAEFTVDYKRIGNTYEQPTDVWALAKVEVHDGFEGDGADTLITEYEYEAGFYDRHEREFYGFKNVKTKQLDTENGDVLYRSTVQEIKNDNYYEKGLVEREFLQDANENLYTESLNTYELRDLSGSALPETFKQDDAGVAFVASTEMQKNFYEGQASVGKSTRMTYDYDAIGNVTTYTDFGDTPSADDITSTISYHNFTSNYLVGAPKEITVSGSEGMLRKRATDIDSNTGNITQIRKYLEDGSSSNFDMLYDGFGNLTKITRPQNSKGERLFYEYQYDPEVNTYTVGTSDGYGYSSSATYDFRFGQMLSNTDLNGQDMRYTIDDVGRITTITGPFELASGKDYTIAFEYHPEAEVPWALTKHFDPEHPDNDLETSTFIDGLKRSLQVKKDGAIHAGPNAADTEQSIVSGRITFDAFGRATESYYPVLEAKGNEGNFNGNYDPVNPTKTTYDVLDRALTVTLPDNAVTQTEYGFGNDRDGSQQFSTKVTDANGIWKESFTNVRGLTKAVKEQYSQGSDIWTSYKYNSINELVEVLDDQDNVINSSYDWLGRRTEVIHPDAGTTTFEYDLANNLTRKVTANLALADTGITYDYDHERLTNINYPQNPQNNVTYTYGDAGADNFRAGRIVTQEDATGTQEFFYNPLGAVSKNTRTIVLPDANPLVYTTEWTYDTWNRVTEMIYPDQETLTYNYNLGGLLHSFSGAKDGTDYNYVKQLGYDKFEQRVYLGYGNDTETFYSYEPDRRRLQNMIAETADDRQMMNNVYTYDKVNNILRLQNNAEIPTSNLMGGQTDYNYQYDDLYRLTNATGSHLGSNHENRYSLNMEYNSIHSITKKDQVHEFKGFDETDWSPRNKTTYDYDYTYGDEQPHAPTQIGENTYTYDANGNQTGWQSTKSGQERQILWDEENRIKAIADNGQAFNYVYDAGGERVLKSNGGGQTVAVNGKKAGSSSSISNYTVYVNPYVVIRNSQVTKHFYIESQRVVTKLTEANEGLLQEAATTTTADVAGTADATNATGAKTTNLKEKRGQLMKALKQNFTDLGLEVDALDKVAGNSGNTPPNGNAFGHGNGNGNNGNGGGNGNDGNGGSGGNGDGTGGTDGNPTTGGGNGNGNNVEAFIFYYHPDHLGSSSYITDANGEVTQHVEYFAFGETFLEEHSNTEATPYLYNGKELDEETGLYYYGARYYDAKTSVWQSVDPLAEKYPSISPYAYVANNPIRFIDPDGRMAVDVLPPTDLYNTKGKKIGTDGVDNGVKIVVTDKKEARQISKIKGNVDLNTVQSGVTLPSDAVLQESVNVLDRTIANGGLKEESSIVMNDGTVVQGQTGSMPTIVNGVQTATATLPNLPTGTTPADAEATIHSHPTTVQQVGNTIYPQSANRPSPTDGGTFSQYNRNVIVGPLGTVNPNNVTSNPNGTLNIPNRPNGAVIYDRNTTPLLELTRKSIKNILKN